MTEAEERSKILLSQFLCVNYLNVLLIILRVRERVKLQLFGSINKELI